MRFFPTDFTTDFTTAFANILCSNLVRRSELHDLCAEIGALYDAEVLLVALPVVAQVKSVKSGEVLQDEEEVLLVARPVVARVQSVEVLQEEEGVLQEEEGVLQEEEEVLQVARPVRTLYQSEEPTSIRISIRQHTRLIPAAYRLEHCMPPRASFGYSSCSHVSLVKSVLVSSKVSSKQTLVVTLPVRRVLVQQIRDPVLHLHTSAYVSIRAIYVSTRQHTSAYVSIRVLNTANRLRSHSGPAPLE